MASLVIVQRGIFAKLVPGGDEVGEGEGWDDD